MQSCDLYNQLNMLFSTLQLPILQLPIVDIKCSRNPKEAHICTQTYRTISTPCQRDAYTDSYPVVSVPSKDIEVGAICGGGGRCMMGMCTPCLPAISDHSHNAPRNRGGDWVRVRCLHAVV